MTGPARYRKKPVVIEAWQINALDYDEMCEIVAWCGGVAIDSGATEYMDGEHIIAIDTLEGRMYADPGDWVIRGVQGEHYPCKPDIFAATYEPEGTA